MQRHMIRRMMKRIPRSLMLIASAFLLLTLLAEEKLPAKISNESFWKLVRDLSEEDGPFPSDNFISNERSYTDVLPDLRKEVVPGGVYIGVGPEQNFTYIAAIQPLMAFIIDIRRQNLAEHLMYKALFEISADRREFLSRLFSRPLIAATKEPASLEDLLALLREASPDEAMFAANLLAIREQLTVNHGFDLAAEDRSRIEYILRSFYTLGPAINYNGPQARNPNGAYPNFVELLQQTTALGKEDNFLSSDDNFRVVQKLQQDNMIIPLVGDFAGPTAIRGVADYLRNHDAAVSVFYTSNVEQYLFRDPGKWEIFYRNAGSLPREAQSLLIRTLLQKDSGVFTPSPVVGRGFRLKTMLYSVEELISKFDADGIKDYADVVRTGNPIAASLEVERISQPVNVGIVEWPNLRPPSGLKVISVSSSEIRLEWPNPGRGDKTAFQISKQIAGEWTKPIHLDYASLCGSDACVFRDTNVKAEMRHCYFVQAATDYSDLGPPRDEDFGEPSITVCSVPAPR
jgi:hypothetical protein